MDYISSAFSLQPQTSFETTGGAAHGREKVQHTQLRLYFRENVLREKAADILNAMTQLSLNRNKFHILGHIFSRMIS